LAEPDGEEEQFRPDWKDYIAIGIAMLETILLPIVIVIVIFVVLIILIR